MAPADVLFGRPLRIKLPGSPLSFQSLTDAPLRQADALAKNRMKQKADRMRRVAPLALRVGDVVLCRQKKEGKLCPAYNPQPYKVIAIKGSMVTAKCNNHVITRNSSHFKTLPANAKNSSQSCGLKVMSGGRDAMNWTETLPEQTPEPLALDPPGSQSPVRRYPVRMDRRPPAHLTDFK